MDGFRKIRAQPTGLDILRISLWMFVAAQALSGCAGALATPTTVPPSVATAIMLELRKRKNLQYSNGTHVDTAGKKLKDKRDLEQEFDRHKGFFLFKRIAIHDPQQVTEATLTLLESELGTVQNFADQQINGTSGLSQPSPDGKSTASLSSLFTCDPDKHLDLENVAAAAVGETVDTNKQSRFQSLRVKAAQAIIWRAAGIHGELWDNSNPPVLDTKALAELLDRRVRLVERMETQANGKRGTLITRTGTTGKTWTDQSRVRLFEYPYFFPLKAEDLIDASDFSNWTVDRDVNTKDGLRDKITFDWKRPAVDTHRVQARIDREHNPDETINPIWTIFDEDYAYERRFVSANGTPPVTLSGAIDKLMTVVDEVYKRTWFYCDHTITTLHLDALRFGLLRRAKHGGPPTDGEKAFNDIGTNEIIHLPASIGAVPGGTLAQPSTWLTAVAETLPGPIFNQRNTGTWFQNVYWPIRDLQVGDHVVFWNHVVYAAISREAFRLENAVITSIDSFPDNGSLYLQRITLSGLGLSSKPLSAYATAMAKDINGNLFALVTKIQAFTDAERAAIDGFVTDKVMLVLKWIPVDGIGGVNDPWFVFLPFNKVQPVKTPYSVIWPDLDSMQKALSHTLVDAPVPPPTYKPIPDTKKVTYTSPDGTTKEVEFKLKVNGVLQGVLFPLFEPTMALGTSEQSTTLTWMQFFVQRKKAENANKAVGLTPTLLSATGRNNLAPTGVTSDIPGFLVAGQSLFPIQVLRPTIRLTPKQP